MKKWIYGLFKDNITKFYTKFYYDKDDKEEIDRISFINKKGTFVYREYNGDDDAFKFWNKKEIISETDVLILEYI